MGKALIITEKPSVAADIARALGGFKKHKEYYESEQSLLSWAVGHLFELAVPASMKEQDKWALDKLPIMPEAFDLEPVDGVRNRVKVLCKLLNDDSVTEVINACDAGREGELIFRYIMQYAGCTKPVKRLWLQSMTPEAIRDGFAHLRTDAEMQPLAQAARCRNEADWLVGINATRAFTLRLRGGRGSTVTSLGRVQTPTLAIIVEREQKIQQFKPREFHELIATFKAESGEYTGRWFDEAYKKDETELDRAARLSMRFGLALVEAAAQLDPAKGSLWDEHRHAARLWHRALAEAVQRRCEGKPGVVELEEKKPVSQLPPQLYDLTSLQREANGRLGFSANRTLQVAQALYEKHKAITYPRTDSRCLPEDYMQTVRTTLTKLSDTALGPFARKVLDNGWVRANKRIFNDAKVGDHFAIIPTGNVQGALGRDEQALFEMIAKRFVAVFFPAAQYMTTTRITRVEGEPFKTEGKILVELGWLEVYGRELLDKPEENLVPVQQDAPVQTTAVEIHTAQTNPPQRYTEATILSAMEGAGKLVEDEELREAMKEKGLGTPATRAAIIETLIAARYLTRHGKELHPTPKAIQTITLLKTAVPELTSPEMTGEWEFKLRNIEQRKLTRDEFMRSIRELTEQIVGKAKSFKPDDHTGDSAPFGKCPKCGRPMAERFRSFSCTNEACDFAVWKTIAGRMLTRAEFETLLSEGHVGPLSGFRSRNGKRFEAELRLNSQFKVEFVFPERPATPNPGFATGEFANTESLGKCPKCGARVFEGATQYACENAVGANRTCQFSTGKVILRKPIDRVQMGKLLQTGRTDLLSGFISKNGRPFKAFLVLGEDGKVGFQFENRGGVGRGAKKTTAQTTKPEKPDFTVQTPLGECPKCAGRVFQTDSAYVCENAQAKPRACRFRISKQILQRTVEPEQVKKLLETGATDLLENFVSRAGKPFAARLVLDKSGKINFEFATDKAA